jgi:hypothetical protein
MVQPDEVELFEADVNLNEYFSEVYYSAGNIEKYQTFENTSAQNESPTE